MNTLRIASLPFAALVAFTVACGSAGTTTPPAAPFAQQFVGTYDVKQPLRTGVSQVTLSRNGSYSAKLANGSIEAGSFSTGLSKALPLTVDLVAPTLAWKATITTYRGEMKIERADATDDATPEGAVGPNQELCERTKGSWRDDDVDRDTGLFCVCPAGTEYVPSEGGCVR